MILIIPPVMAQRVMFLIPFCSSNDVTQSYTLHGEVSGGEVLILKHL